MYRFQSFALWCLCSKLFIKYWYALKCIDMRFIRFSLDMILTLDIYRLITALIVLCFGWKSRHEATGGWRV